MFFSPSNNVMYHASLREILTQFLLVFSFADDEKEQTFQQLDRGHPRLASHDLADRDRALSTDSRGFPGGLRQAYVDRGRRRRSRRGDKAVVNLQPASTIHRRKQRVAKVSVEYIFTYIQYLECNTRIVLYSTSGQRVL